MYYNFEENSGVWVIFWFHLTPPRHTSPPRKRNHAEGGSLRCAVRPGGPRKIQVCGRAGALFYEKLQADKLPGRYVLFPCGCRH